MFNVCPQCGEYSDKKTIDPRGPFADYLRHTAGTSTPPMATIDTGYTSLDESVAMVIA